jgi:hypothetical protein
VGTVPTRKASEEEIQRLSGKAEMGEAIIAVNAEVGTSVSTQPSNVEADLGTQPTTVEATAESSVPLPEGVDLNKYPDSHEEEQPVERVVVRPSQSCARNAGGRQWRTVQVKLDIYHDFSISPGIEQRTNIRVVEKS